MTPSVERDVRCVWHQRRRRGDIHQRRYTTPSASAFLGSGSLLTEELQMNVLKVTDSASYLHERGMPVLAIWGKSRRPSLQAEAESCLQEWACRMMVIRRLRWFDFWIGFKAWCRRAHTSLLGVHPTGGRGMAIAIVIQRSGKSGVKCIMYVELVAYAADIWKKADITRRQLSPWYVGRFSDGEGADVFRQRMRDDMALLKREDTMYGINRDYTPVVVRPDSWSRAGSD